METPDARLPSPGVSIWRAEKVGTRRHNIDLWAMGEGELDFVIAHLRALLTNEDVLRNGDQYSALAQRLAACLREKAMRGEQLRLYD